MRINGNKCGRTKKEGRTTQILSAIHRYKKPQEGIPAKAKAMVKEFILKNQKELEEMWEKEQYKKLPPLDWDVS